MKLSFQPMGSHSVKEFGLKFKVNRAETAETKGNSRKVEKSSLKPKRDLIFAITLFQLAGL